MNYLQTDYDSSLLELLINLHISLIFIVILKIYIIHKTRVILS